MEDKELMEVLIDVNHIMYEHCSDMGNCKNCILRTARGTLCLGEKYYQMLQEINGNYKKIKKEREEK